MSRPGFPQVVRGLLVAVGLFFLLLQVALMSRGPSAVPAADRLLPIAIVAR